MESQAGVFQKAAVDLQINRPCSFISALAWLNRCSNMYSASLIRRPLIGQNRIYTTKAEYHYD